MSIFKLCRRPEVSFVAKPGETYMEIPEIEVSPMKYSEKRPNPLGREQRAVFPEEYQAGKEAWMQPKVVSAPDNDDVSLTTGCAGLRRHVDNIRMPGEQPSFTVSYIAESSSLMYCRKLELSFVCVIARFDYEKVWLE